jgi:hypothetical protein
MRMLVVLFLVALPALSALAEKPAASVKVSVEQLKQALAADRDKLDADVARQLLNMELTERLSTVELAKLKADLPGSRAQEALVALADLSGFLDPPAEQIPPDATPDGTAAHQMLAHIVNYVNTTVRQLPNLIATRDTTGYEDRPAEDIVQETASVSLSSLPLHVVGRSSVTVTYRDRKEVVDEGAAKVKKSGPAVHGLETGGVFGPILSVVVADAMKGKITWGRWEMGAAGPEAVFHYAVTKEESDYKVQFCCVSAGIDSSAGGQTDWQVFSELVAYHGEIAFDPVTGAILRITLEAEMPPNEIVAKAGLLVEYAPVEIAGKTYTCPVKSVSILKAHSEQPSMGMHMASSYKGPGKTFLNEVAFGQYRRFGSETRILTGDSLAPNQPGGPASVDSPYAPPSRAPTH